MAGAKCSEITKWFRTPIDSLPQGSVGVQCGGWYWHSHYYLWGCSWSALGRMARLRDHNCSPEDEGLLMLKVRPFFILVLYARENLLR